MIVYLFKDTSKNLFFGLQGTVGINRVLKDKLDLFTEINFVSMSHYAKERKSGKRHLR